MGLFAAFVVEFTTIIKRLFSYKKSKCLIMVTTFKFQATTNETSVLTFYHNAEESYTV